MFRTRWALAALLAACLVGACSDDDPKPNIAEPTTSAVSSSPTQETSPTASPAAPSPKATVRAWVDARNEALNDGDTALVRRLSAPRCPTCDQHIEPIEAVYQAGGSFRTPGWTVDKLKVTKETNEAAKVDVAMTMAAGETVEHAGAAPVAYAEDHRLMFFHLAKAHNVWLVSFIGYYS